MPLTDAQTAGLEAAILAYLVAKGERFARTAAAFNEEAQLQDCDGDDAPVVSGTVLEKAWTHVKRILSRPAASGALYDAIESGDAAEVQLYVCVGVDVEALRCDGRHEYEEVSPLFCAAYHNRLELVQYFVQGGHNKEVGCHDGSSPLFTASQHGHFAVVQYLVEKGADKDRADNRFFTPLFISAQEGHFSVVQYLVEQGANKDKTVEDDWTPLMVACHEGHMDVAEYLLDQGCDRDHVAEDGYTALHCAAQENRLEVAQLLFRYGAKLDIRDKYGYTPADLAIAHGHHNIADAIRAEEIRRRDHGFKRDRSTIEGTEEHEAAKRPRVEEPAAAEEVDESDDDDDDDDDDDEEEGK